MRIGYRLLGFVLALLPFSAAAADVDFTGTVSGLCSVALGLNGTLNLSADGTILGSQEGAAVGGTVLILSVGTSTIEVAAPVRIGGNPAGYDDSLEELEVAYAGLNGLSGVSQAYTDQATSFQAANIPLTTLNVHNRIVNPNGFVAGSYSMRTVITCS